MRDEYVNWSPGCVGIKRKEQAQEIFRGYINRIDEVRRARKKERCLPYLWLDD